LQTLYIWSFAMMGYESNFQPKLFYYNINLEERIHEIGVKSFQAVAQITVASTIYSMYRYCKRYIYGALP